MSKADDILRERERHEATRADSDNRAQAVAKQKAEAKLANEIRSETAIVLQLLETKGYPFMEGLTIDKPRFGSKTASWGVRCIRMSAWPIASYNYVVHGDSQTSKIYLLSDGLFCFSGGYSGGSARGLDDEYLRKYLTNIIDGLQSLRARLE